MNENTPSKPKRQPVTVDLSPSARRSLTKIKTRHGLTKKAAVEQGIALLEIKLMGPVL